MNSPAQPVRRPLVAAALSAAAGLAVPALTGSHPLFWLSAGALWLALQCRRLSAPGLYAALFLLAAAAGSMETFPQMDGLSPVASRVPGRPQTVAGRIASDVQIAGGQAFFRLQTDRVEDGGTIYAAEETLQVYLRQPPARMVYGERWILRGMLTDYESSYGGVAGGLSANGSSARRLQPAGFSLRGGCYALRRRAAGILHEAMAGFPEAESILQALLFGLRRQMSTSLYQTFARTGMLHLFAISGLHVGVMAALLISLLKTAGVSRPRWGLLLIPALFVYVVATGMKPSALRAFTMASVYFAAPLIGRRPDALSSVSLAALILLAVSPGRIADPGFLLSFTVVTGIILVHGCFQRYGIGWHKTGWATALYVPGRKRPGSGVLRAAGLLMITSLAAWSFSVPLTARFFNTLSPAALAGNLAAVPLTFVIVLTGCLTVLSGTVSGPAADLFAHANWLFVGVLTGIIRRLAEWPGAWFYVRAPSLAAMAFWYGGLVVLLTGMRRVRVVGAGLVLAGVLLFVHINRDDPPPGPRIFYPAESATAVHLPSGSWVLFCRGDPFDTPRIIRFLQKNGVSQLQLLGVSESVNDPQAVRRLVTIFRPQTVRCAAQGRPLELPAGTGILRLNTN